MPSPNLLFLTPDDHAASALGVAGDRHARTPNLDRLAEQGVRFTQNCCQYPVCTPSRQSFFTGQMPHSAGVTQLETALSTDKPTLAKQFKASGYETAAFGKLHFNREGYPGMHGFDICQTDLVWYEDKEFEAGYPGIPTQTPWRPFVDPAERWLNADRRPYPATIDEMPNSKVADAAIDWLKSRDPDTPFAMWTGFNQPHSPFFFPVEYADAFSPDEFTLPAFPESDRDQIPLAFRGLTDEQRRGILAAYYTALSFLDYNAGRVLDALDACGLAENTLVVYLSDHGFVLGQHGRFEKHCLYDEALRVPLILRWPGVIRPGTVNRMTESLDVPATILDLMGLDPLPVQHGTSLRPLLEDPSGPGRETIFSENLENEEACVRTERWKLIYCSGKRARLDGMQLEDPTPGRYLRLFDLAADPEEFTDVSGDHPGVVAELLDAMVTRIRDTHPDRGHEPTRLAVVDALDFYLAPRDAGGPAAGTRDLKRASSK